MRTISFFITTLLLTFFCSVSSLFAGQVSITAASDLQYAMKDIIAAFEKTNPTDKVSAVFGSSGKAVSQIENGAPYDLFFSADISYPEKLRASGAAISTPKPYAVGRIVVWVTRQSGLDVRKGMKVLLDPKVKKIALANPAHAPYGRIGKEVMEHYGIYDKLQDKLVLGENIQQTAQFVETGAADAGLVAYSLALAPALANVGNYYLVPAEAHKPIVQGYVLLKPAAGNGSAAKFETFIASPTARAIFRKYGFSLPNE
jgi:molybdate transport system substrate-binding protein